MKSKPTTNSVDIFVGKKLESRRKELNLSHEYLSDKLNIAVQQIHKYEQGTKRIGADILPVLAEVLEVDFSFFFEGIAEEGIASSLSPVEDSELSLMAAYKRILHPDIRRNIIRLIEFIAVEEREHYLKSMPNWKGVLEAK